MTTSLLNKPSRQSGCDGDARFWKRVTKTGGCWLHSGSIGSHGYPQATLPNKRMSYPAHRVSWLLQVGEIPPGQFVLHGCDNKRCVRVGGGHLYLGDHKQNMADMARVGHPRRKLTASQVRMIRTSALPQRTLAQQLGVNQATIANVRNRKVYRFVKGAA